MKQKIVRTLKILVLLIIFSCMGSFIYYSISVSLPVFKIDGKPSVKVIFNIDENNIIEPHISVTDFRFINKFGGHSVVNPIYLFAKALFYKPKELMLCLDDSIGRLPLKKRNSQDWFTHWGWFYYLDTQGENAFIADFPKDRSINEALLVEGECAEAYADNTFIIKYDVRYRVADLDSL